MSLYSDGIAGPVSVFLKVAETATCTVDPCTFTYNEPSAEITGFITPLFDDDLLEWVVKVEGTGFGTST